MKLNILQSILLFVFGIICLFTIETCYYDYIYSEQKVITRLNEEFHENPMKYLAFFEYTSNLNDSINWDSIELSLKKVQYEIVQEVHVNFNTFNSGGISYSGLNGCIVSLPNENITNDRFNMYKDDIGLSISQIKNLKHHLTEINESDFIIFKDGTVIINKLIGPEIFDMETYQIIYKGERMYLFGNYINTFPNVFVGKEN